jgi:phosphatidylglycerophosphatase A
MSDHAKHFLLTAGGLGHAPVASGTFGTLGGVVLAVLVHVLLPPATWVPVWAGLALVLLWFGCALGPWAVVHFNTKDPKPFVLDEVVGYLVAAVVFGLAGPFPLVGGHLGLFFAFRVFDVLKISPARELERLPHGFGIMLDDVAAGVYAGLSLLLLRWAGVSWL